MTVANFRAMSQGGFPENFFKKKFLLPPGDHLWVTTLFLEKFIRVNEEIF